MTILALALACLLCVLPATAAPPEDWPGVGALEQALPSEAETWMPPGTPAEFDLQGLWETISGPAEEKLRQAFAEEWKTAGVLLTVCVLIALADTLDASGGTPRYILLAGVTAIGAASLEDFDYYLNLGLGSVRSMTDYSRALLPVLASASAAAGSVTGAAGRYAATALFMDLLTNAADRWIVPGICACAALSIADAAVGNQALKTAKKLLKSLCRLLLTALCLSFTAWLSFSGIVTDSADAMTARMAKTAVSAALPVVGGILSDAAGTLAAAAGTLRVSVGAYGIAAVLCTCLGPFIILGVRYLTFKVSAALCGCVTDKRLSTLVEDLSGCFGMVLALNGTAALMMFVSIYSLIRTVIW